MKKNLLSAVLVSGMMVSTASNAQTLFGVTNTNAVFVINDVSTPSSITGPLAVTGLASGQAIIGLHSRPSNGKWYALAYDSVAATAELYTVTNSGTTFTATPVSGTIASINLGANNNGSFSFIASTTNQIRVVGRNGNNYVMNADNGTVVSTGATGLSYGISDILNGASTSLAATAYTNNFYGADATDEVGFDAVNNMLVAMDAGSFSNGFNNTSNTLHSLGASGTGTGIIFDLAGNMSMDTWYDTVSHSNTIYFAGKTLLGGSHLYKYNMSGTGGLLTDLGAIGSGSLMVRGIGFASTRDTTSAITGKLMTGLSLNLRKLLYFDSNNPRNIRRAVSLNGMTSGQAMVGIDYAADGTLYGLGYNSTAHTYQLYTIDSATGNVSAVNATAGTLNLGTDDGSGNYINVGFRIIPTLTNRIRVMGNHGTVNTQLDATTGLIVSTDTAMSYITGDTNFGLTPSVTSIAYTGYNGDTTTQMFGFDANTASMVKFDETNSASGYGNGSSGYASTNISLNTVLSLFTHSSAYNNAYMNIAFDQSTNTNVGFIAANYFGDSGNLQQNYAILYDMSDMLTGYHRGTVAGPTTVGGIGEGIPVKDVTMRRAYTPITAAVGNIASGLNDLLVYPNPANTVAHIVLPAVAVTSVFVDVIDLNGRIDRSFQYAPGVTQLDVDMSRLPTGLYSVRVYDQISGYYNLKVVKE